MEIEEHKESILHQLGKAVRHLEESDPTDQMRKFGAISRCLDGNSIS